MRLHDITSSSAVAENKHCRAGPFWWVVGDIHMKVSIHIASHIDTRLAVGRVRDRDRVRVRDRISYSQANRMAIHTPTSEASRVYSISRLHQGVDWLPYEDVDFSRPQYS